MFTGLVEAIGRVTTVTQQGQGTRVTIEVEGLTDDLAIGDSIAVSGCCLTTVARSERAFDVELSAETLRATAPRWHVGARVNLERALAANGRFGGHVVSGHVEGIGRIVERTDREDATIVRVETPTELARWWIPKGSVTVDGVSLTVVDVGGPGGTRSDLPAESFTLWLIPHTLRVTTLGDLVVGDVINLEADVLARYAARAAALDPDRSHGGAA